ncbi:hypothetical protein BBJ29_007733 [Phytophthora kernoviae]|uniref:WW domain-containing protein n=1 Tax=Phytophthora kernoviae TaxID=325452 RepID=A0A3F2RLA0_9STRA|nr:hypothetical protein BBJ29_007733 [Phytophthora kernoviae]RLN59752.1 hypothetical protein BBP00_00006335 [Phytophthora kernoviae]
MRSFFSKRNAQGQQSRKRKQTEEVSVDVVPAVFEGDESLLQLHAETAELLRLVKTPAKPIKKTNKLSTAGTQSKGGGKTRLTIEVLDDDDDEENQSDTKVTGGQNNRSGEHIQPPVPIDSSAFQAEELRIRQAKDTFYPDMLPSKHGVEWQKNAFQREQNRQNEIHNKERLRAEQLIVKKQRRCEQTLENRFETSAVMIQAHSRGFLELTYDTITPGRYADSEAGDMESPRFDRRRSLPLQPDEDCDGSDDDQIAPLGAEDENSDWQTNDTLFRADGTKNSKLRDTIRSALHVSKFDSISSLIASNVVLRRKSVSGRGSRNQSGPATSGSRRREIVLGKRDEPVLVAVLTRDRDKRRERTKVDKGHPESPTRGSGMRSKAKAASRVGKPPHIRDLVDPGFHDDTRTEHQQDEEGANDSDDEAKEAARHHAVSVCFNCWSASNGRQCDLHQDPKDVNRKVRATESALMCANWELDQLRRKYRAEEIQEIFMKQRASLRYDKKTKQYVTVIECRHPMYRALENLNTAWNKTMRRKLHTRSWFRSFLEQLRSDRLPKVLGGGEKAGNRPPSLFKLKTTLQNTRWCIKYSESVNEFHPKAPVTAKDRTGKYIVPFGNFVVFDRRAVAPSPSCDESAEFVCLIVAATAPESVFRALEHALNVRRPPCIVVAARVHSISQTNNDATKSELLLLEAHRFPLNRPEQTGEEDANGFRTFWLVDAFIVPDDVPGVQVAPTSAILAPNMASMNATVTTRVDRTYPFCIPTTRENTPVEFIHLLWIGQSSRNQPQAFTTLGRQQPGDFMKNSDPDGALGSCSSVVYRSWAYMQDSPYDEFVTEDGVAYWYDRTNGNTFWTRPVLPIEKFRGKDGGVDGVITTGEGEVATLGVGLGHTANGGGDTDAAKDGGAARYSQQNLRKYMTKKMEAPEDKERRVKLVTASAKKHDIVVELTSERSSISIPDTKGELTRIQANYLPIIKNMVSELIRSHWDETSEAG